MLVRRLVLGLTLVAAACSGTPEATDTNPLVVTTVAPITNIVRNVAAGTNVVVRGIIPEGTDSHTFEPRPTDVRTIARASIVLVNGLHLEESTVALAKKNVRNGARVVALGERTITREQWVFDFSFPKDKGDPNPHLWMNPIYAKRYAEIAAAELGKVVPKDAARFTQNAKTLGMRLEALDAKIALATSTVPQARRKLLTYHDSFAYFAPRYGFTVIGAVQPADFAEAAASDIARFIDQVKAEQVPAVFGSEVFSSTVLDRVAKQTGISFVTTLRDDSLPGKPDAPEHTYMQMLVEDVSKIVTALGGNASALDGFDTRNLT